MVFYVCCDRPRNRSSETQKIRGSTYSLVREVFKYVAQLNFRTFDFRLLRILKEEAKTEREREGGREGERERENSKTVILKDR